MRTHLNALLVAGLILGLLPAVGGAQVNLAIPPDGANLTSPPTFSWTGPYDAWLFLSVFYYDIAGVYSGYYSHWFWLLSPGFDMPGASWWDLIGEGSSCFWAVLGYNTTTQDYVWSAPSSFTKGMDCISGEPCGQEPCCLPGTCDQGECRTRFCQGLFNQYLCSGGFSCCEPTECCAPDESCHSNGSVSRCCPQDEPVCWGKGEAQGLSWCCPATPEPWECCGMLFLGKGLCCPPPSFCCETGCCTE